jgi:hypothetical protein
MYARNFSRENLKEKARGRPRHREDERFKTDHKETVNSVEAYELDFSGSEWRPVADVCESNNELWVL